MTAPTAPNPTQSPRGPNYPLPGSRPQAFVDYVNGILADGEQDAIWRFRQATRNLLYADGRQHIDWSRKANTWLDAPVPEGRIIVTMNYIRPILRARAQRMLSAPVVWRAVPPTNGYEDRDRATIATNLLTSRWEKLQMDSKVGIGLWLAFNCGVSFLKTFWNPAIGPLTNATVILPHLGGLLHPAETEDGQPNPAVGQPVMTEYPVDRQGNPLRDENGNPAQNPDNAFRYRPGDTDTALRSIFNVRVNPDAWGLAVSEGFRWLIDTELVPIWVVKERYGERAAKVSPASGSGVNTTRNYQRIIRSLGPGFGSGFGEDLLTSKGGRTLPSKDETLLAEMWEPPSDPYPAGRYIVVAGDQLIYPLDPSEEGLPQGIVPYVGLYDERRPFDPYGRGSTTDLTTPQNVINKQWGGILEEQRRSGIGQWIMWGVPGLSNQITNLDGAHIEVPAQTAYANRSISDIVQRVPPVAASPDRWRMIQEAKATMFDIGAYHEVQRGQVPPGVDSGIAVQLLQEAENAQLHEPVRAFKTSLLTWGLHQLKLGRWGYGEQEQRWIPVNRPDLGYLVESVSGADLPDPDTIELKLDGFKPTSAAAMRQEIKEFVTEGWMDARQGLLLMDMGRGIEGAFESQTRHYARARMENLEIERGQCVIIEHPPGSPLAGLPALVSPDKTPYLLPADDDHEVHIRIHQDIALDNSKPWQTREKALLHIAEHRAMLAMAMAEAAAQSADQGGRPAPGGPGQAGQPGQQQEPKPE